MERYIISFCGKIRKECFSPEGVFEYIYNNKELPEQLTCLMPGSSRESERWLEAAAAFCWCRSMKDEAEWDMGLYSVTRM